MSNKKYTFSMNFTAEQKELLELLVDLEFPFLELSKAGYFLQLIRYRSLGYIFPDDADLEKISMSDTQILNSLKNKEKEFKERGF